MEYFHQVFLQTIAADYPYSGDLEVRLINGVLSTPIRFVYSDFSTVDRLFCKYTNSSTPFASFEAAVGSTGRVLTPYSSDYSIVNSSIGTFGYFGLQIIGRIDRDDGNSIICQFSTQYTIGSSGNIILSVIVPILISMYVKPLHPLIGDTLYVGCIIQGYPYPVVEVEIPNNVHYRETQLNPSTTKLTSYKYEAMVRKVDESWSGKRVYCSTMQSGSNSIEKFITIRISGVRGFTNHIPGLMTGLIVSGLITVIVVILIIVSIIIINRRKRQSKMLNNRYNARDDGSNVIPESNDVFYPDGDDTNINTPPPRNINPYSNAYEVSTAAFV